MLACWMLFFLGCLVLFLFPFTLLFSLCYFGYARVVDDDDVMFHELVRVFVFEKIEIDWVFGFCVEWSWQIGKADDVVDGVL